MTSDMVKLYDIGILYISNVYIDLFIIVLIILVEVHMHLIIA